MVVLIKAAAPTSHALASMALIDFQKTVAKAYRDLLRAQQHAFSGDFRVLAAAREEARRQFRTTHIEGADRMEAKLKEAREVCTFLRRNLVQGVPAGQDSPSFRLRLTEQHEINDKIEPIKTRHRCC